MTGFAAEKSASSPPHITVSAPFSAPAWPPETGASMNLKPFSLAASANSRASSAEAVVLSMSVAPGFMPAKMPSSPWTTEWTSSSLPTHMKTKSASLAASRGVGAWPPPYWAAHFSAFAAVRFQTVTSWSPLVFRWPAMG